MRTPLILRYFIWSMLIFALSMGLFSFRMLRSLELRTLDLASGQRYGYGTKLLKEVDLPVLILPVYDEMSQETYLEFARDAVHHLKNAGAKVVIVPFPEFLQPSAKISTIIQEIAGDSIVVFGAQNPLNSPYAWPPNPSLDDKRHWWVHHPLYNRVKVPWGVMSLQAKDFSPLYRFIPTGFREFNTGESVPDVAVLALKRYFDIPDNVEIQPLSSRLQFGPGSIELQKDGVSYLRVAFTPRKGYEVYAGINPTSDSLFFYPWGSSGQPNEQSLTKAWQEHRGKIVIIDWNRVQSYRFPSIGWAYFQVFGAVFNRSFVSVHNEWTVLLITALVVLLSVFSYIFRNGLTVFVAFVFAAASVVVSIWLFDSHSVLFEPVYALVPILLCGFILPIVKIAGEKRIAEERIKSLEEENRRLQELQRSTPAGPMV